MSDDGSKMLEEYDFSHAKRGSIVPSTPGQTRITIRIDTDILNWFRQQVNEAGGGNYQSNINQALREYMESRKGTTERGQPIGHTIPEPKSIADRIRFC